MGPDRDRELSQLRGNDKHGYFSLNLASSRGCPFRCNWCAKPIYGSRYRVRSAGALAAEMLEMKRTSRPDHLWFCDDIFALSPALDIPVRR